MRRVHLPSPALVVALLALVIAAGGTSYAVSALPKNSVGTTQLKKHAVTTPKLATSAAARIAGLTYTKGSLTVPAGMAGAVSVPCAKGLAAISGGLETPHADSAYLVDSHPIAGGWQMSVANPLTADQQVTVYAVCAQAAKGTPTTANVTRNGASFHALPSG